MTFAVCRANRRRAGTRRSRSHFPKRKGRLARRPFRFWSRRSYFLVQMFRSRFSRSKFARSKFSRSKYRARRGAELPSSWLREHGKSGGWESSDCAAQLGASDRNLTSAWALRWWTVSAGARAGWQRPSRHLPTSSSLVHLLSGAVGAGLEAEGKRASPRSGLKPGVAGDW